MTVAILAYERVSAYEALGALAALHAAGIPAELVSDDALVLAREGARLVPARLGPATLETAPAAILPGGHADPLLTHAPLAKALRARRGRWTLASGAGIRLAHAAGLPEGRRVAGPTTARLVAAGRLLTCAGGDAIIDLALHYAARELGDDAAAKAAHALGREHRPYAKGAADPAD